MDFMELIDLCKDLIIAEYPALHRDELDQMWNGGMMELQRMLFRDRKGMDLYMVTYNTLTEESSVLKYVIEPKQA